MRICREFGAVALIVAVGGACENGVLEQNAVASDGNLSAESWPPDGPVTHVDTDENYNCTSRVTGTFANVFVPAGEACYLEDAVVNGNVLAREQSRLFVSDSDIAGNIDGVEADVVQVRGGSLEGSIQIQDGSSPGEVGALIIGTLLGQGNITIQKLRTGGIEIRDVALVKGNIQIQQNQADIHRHHGRRPGRGQYPGSGEHRFLRPRHPPEPGGSEPGGVRQRWIRHEGGDRQYRGPEARVQGEHASLHRWAEQRGGSRGAVLLDDCFPGEV